MALLRLGFDVSCSVSQTHSNWTRVQRLHWANTVCGRHPSRHSSHMCTQACDGQTFRVKIKWVTHTHPTNCSGLCSSRLETLTSGNTIFSWRSSIKCSVHTSVPSQMSRHVTNQCGCQSWGGICFNSCVALQGFSGLFFQYTNVYTFGAAVGFSYVSSLLRATVSLG